MTGHCRGVRDVSRMSPPDSERFRPSGGWCRSQPRNGNRKLRRGVAHSRFDYGGSMNVPPEFGISITPNWQEQRQVLRLAEAADQAGLDLLGIQDHPYQWRFYDTWTLIAHLAGRTSRVRFFPDVANLPLRPPAVLAKSAASLDVLTGGRVELGLGAGGFWDAIEAMGGPRRSPGQAVEATEEAIDVIRLMWSGERGVKYDGRHYRLSGVHTRPRHRHLAGSGRPEDARPDRTKGRRVGAVRWVDAPGRPSRAPQADRGWGGPSG